MTNEKYGMGSRPASPLRALLAFAIAGLALLVFLPSASAMQVMPQSDCGIPTVDIVCDILEAVCDYGGEGAIGEGLSPVVVNPIQRGVGIAKNALTAMPGEYNYFGLRVLC